MKKYCYTLSFLFLSFCVTFAQGETNTTFFTYKKVNNLIQIHLHPSSKWKGDQTKPIFSIDTKSSFLSIAKSTPKVKETYGFFKFRGKQKDKCKKPSITGTLFRPTSVEIQGELCGCKYSLMITGKDSTQIDLAVTLSDKSYNRITLQYLSDKEETILGLGEQYTHNNMKGQKVPIWVEEQGIGSGDQPTTMIANTKIAGGTPVSTYAPIPYYITDNHTAFLLRNTARASFCFRSKDHVGLEVWENNLRASLWQMNTPKDLARSYTAQYGRLPKLPKWTYGTIVGLQGGRKIVEDYVDSLEASGTAISAIWVQDWVGRRRTFVGDQLKWYWEADEERYPNFKEFCQKMEARGIAVLGYINPMLTNDGALYKEADEKGYLVKDHTKKTYVIRMTGFDVGLIDLTNPAARTWIKDIIKNNMIAYGLKGWMADFGEALPWDAVLHSGISPQLYHNQYPVDWAKVNREAIQEVEQEEKIAFFSRSSFTGGSQYSTFYWAGDQMTSWQKNDGLPSIVPALVSSGISGMSINHADVGGFAGFWKGGGLFAMRRKEKLLQRHIELGVFSPLFRTHEGIIPQRNIQVYSNTEIKAFYSKFSQIRTQLIPYLESIATEANLNGYPMARHLYLEFPNDNNCLSINNQFLLGDAILVAPYVKKGGKKHKIYLPKGEWRHLLTNEILKGGQFHKVNAPIGTPSVFVSTASEWNEKLKFN